MCQNWYFLISYAVGNRSVSSLIYIYIYIHTHTYTYTYTHTHIHIHTHTHTHTHTYIHIRLFPLKMIFITFSSFVVPIRIFLQYKYKHISNSFLINIQNVTKTANIRTRIKWQVSEMESTCCVQQVKTSMNTSLIIQGAPKKYRCLIKRDMQNKRQILNI